MQIIRSKSRLCSKNLPAKPTLKLYNRACLQVIFKEGSSALCLAEGLQKDGTLHTIDVNAELKQMQRSFFDRSPYGPQIIQHVGDALGIIPKLDTTFDLIFIDAEKKQYIKYLETVLPKTKTGSIILSDNVLWSGKVVEPLDPKDKATKILLEYNKKLSEHPLLETVLLLYLFMILCSK